MVGSHERYLSEKCGAKLSERHRYRLGSWVLAVRDGSNININNNLLYNIGNGSGGTLFQVLGYQNGAL